MDARLSVADVVPNAVIAVLVEAGAAPNILTVDAE